MKVGQLYHLLGKKRFQVTTFNYVLAVGETQRSYKVFVAVPRCDTCRGPYKEAHFGSDVMPALNQWLKEELGKPVVYGTIKCEDLYTEEARAQLDLETSIRAKEKTTESIWLVFEWRRSGDMGTSNEGTLKRVTF